MVKSLKAIAAVIFLLGQSQGYAQGHNINITVTNVSEPSVIVGYHYGNQRLVLDTLFFDDKSMIQIKGENALPQGVYFLYTPTFYFEFLVYDQVFEMKTTASGGYNALTVTNSPENESFRKFQVSMTRLQKEQRILQDNLKIAENKADSVKIYEQLSSFSKEADSIRRNLIAERPESFFTSFIRLMDEIEIPKFEELKDESEKRRAQFRYYKSHYFDYLPDPAAMMRTPMIHGYVMKYFNDLVLTDPDSVNMEIDRWIEKLGDNKEAFRYWLITLYNKYQDSKIMGMDGVTLHLIEKYYLSDRVNWMDEKAKNELKDEIKFIKPNIIGKDAPMLYLVDTLMKPIVAQTLPAEYLVLFFYDPDCGVCKKKTPILKENYEAIKKLKGEVVAVCTTTETDKWKNYIRTNKLNWVNLADPQYRSNFRMDYNVRSTPQIYILDKDRKIVAKRLDVEQVVNFLEEHTRLMRLTKQ